MPETTSHKERDKMKLLAIKITLVLSILALAATLLVPVASAGKPKSGQTVTMKANLDEAFKRRLRY